ncbi:MAG: N-6 DNA methylase [Nitrospirales bacterium]|nr:N-6 DNA methylase [Nitrospirales bacterium]
MLDTDTKRRIDTARDILVGKVPDPKSQVEQITIALIYKFMDDMDAESEEFGGKRKFFAGKFARYGWAKLMRSGLGGHEILNLYAEAIAKMPENPGIPLLFRDIFKNAYLPYRDPETLRAFLKIIDEFTYEHSERLGDAYEYLLSVLGSQGDAGQFRTPRHIIDFIVAILDPKKTETVLDPACGTAGFLISSYKHILRENSSAEGIEPNGSKNGDEAGLHSSRIPSAKGDLLTPDEKGRLATNFKGYDISPDMVRLSLVNLYLHGFTDPHIFEYDTLTSQDRWSEYADVILANPPFMTPKGGIKPHNRFSVQSKRSEVLFVDYMAEHLTPTGRAGIIVPEGIIFQSQNAYTQLRKMLVEEYLVAVISLPAGVFNPYSGVKTSILILDKSLAKKTNTIAFFKIENDGFGLGTQRRPIEKNDLPQALVELNEFLRKFRSQEPVEDLHPTLGLIILKEKIAENGDYNLSGERYRESGAAISQYPHVTLNEVCEINPETVNPADAYPGSFFNYIDISCVANGSGKFLGASRVTVEAAPSRARRLVSHGDVLISTVRPNLKAFSILTEVPDRAVASTGFAVLRAKADRLLSGFLILMLRNEKAVDQMVGMMGKGAYPSINQSDIESVQIPLPPLEMQKEIVGEIEGYQIVFEGARTVLDNYRPHIPIHPDWPKPNFIDAPFEIIDGDRGVNYPKKEDFSNSGYCLFLNTKNVRSDGFNFSELEFISKEKDEALRKGKLQRGDVVLTTRGTIGNTGYYDESVKYEHVRINSGMLIFRSDTTKLSRSYLFHFFQSQNFKSQRDAIISGAAQPQLPIRSLNDANIPLPPLTTQQAIVAEIEAEQALVASNRELIERFEKKIQATLAKVWGEEKPTSAETPIPLSDNLSITRH